MTKPKSRIDSPSSRPRASRASDTDQEGTMKFPHRRQFLHLAAGAAALPAVSRMAKAQSYPTRPVRIVVPAAPAGSFYIVARLLGQWLSLRLRPQFVIQERP